MIKLILKAKRMPIGTISRGRKKIAERKWVPVSSGRGKIVGLKMSDLKGFSSSAKNTIAKELGSSLGFGYSKTPYGGLEIVTMASAGSIEKWTIHKDNTVFNEGILTPAHHGYKETLDKIKGGPKGETKKQIMEKVIKKYSKQSENELKDRINIMSKYL